LCRHIEIDFDAAFEGVLFGNEGQIETIAYGLDIIPEAKFRRLSRSANSEQKKPHQET
jgi:hypothetical protein